MNDAALYVYAIAPLLPLSAAMVVFQVNPYYALVLRGILGAMAALIYTLLGAADVALTEALVGTLLAIMLYAVAVRSSLVLRLGVLEEELPGDQPKGTVSSEDTIAAIAQEPCPFNTLLKALQKVISQHYMRLELVPFPNPQALQRALVEKEIHAACVRSSQTNALWNGTTPTEKAHQPYHTTVRVKRIHDIFVAELASPETSLSYFSPADATVFRASTTHLEEQHP